MKLPVNCWIVWRSLVPSFWKRPYYAKVRAQDRNGQWYEAEGEELIARCFCHELDHLDGIIYTEVMERWLTDEELEADE